MGPVVRSQCCVVLRVGGVGMYSCVAFVRSVESEGVVDVVTSTGMVATGTLRISNNETNVTNHLLSSSPA